MKHLLTIISCMMLLTACHKDDSPKEIELPERTVIVYMAGENNLNSFVNEDLDEMKQGSKNIGNNNLVVFVDKAESQLPYILNIKNGKTVDSVECTRDGKTSDPAFFEEILRYAVKNYEAKSYGLVLWGHATGWLIEKDSVAYNAMSRRKAYGGDTGNNSSSGSGKTWMNIPSMARAMKQLPHFDFIFADCCCFICAESAYELKDVTDYLIGSPAEIPAVGAPYETVVPAMMSKEQFWKDIVDRYFEQTTSSGNKVPLSVVKGSEVKDFAQATRSILNSIYQSRETNDYYPLTGLIYYFNQNLYDMNDFMKKYGAEGEYASWKQALDKAVCYKRTTMKWDTDWNVIFSDFKEAEEANFGGISMFIPQWKFQSSYNDYIKQMGWYYAAGYADIGW